MMSMTKSLTTVLVAKYVAESLIDLNKTVADYMQSWPKVLGPDSGLFGICVMVPPIQKSMTIPVVLCGKLMCFWMAGTKDCPNGAMRSS